MIQLLSANSGGILVHYGNGADGKLEYKRARIGLFIRSDTILTTWAYLSHWKGEKTAEARFRCDVSGDLSVHACRYEAVNRGIDPVPPQRPKKIVGSDSVPSV